MLIIKYPDNEKWPELIKACMPISKFMERFGLKGGSRMMGMALAKNLPLKTVVFVSEAIEQILEEKKAIEEKTKKFKEDKGRA